PGSGRRACSRGPPFALVVEERERRVAARRAGDAAAGVRARAAHPEVSDRRLVLRPARRGAQEEELMERELAVEDVAARDRERLLDVGGGVEVLVEDEVSQVRRILRQRVDDHLEELR